MRQVIFEIKISFNEIYQDTIEVPDYLDESIIEELKKIRTANWFATRFSHNFQQDDLPPPKWDENVLNYFIEKVSKKEII